MSNISSSSAISHAQEEDLGLLLISAARNFRGKVKDRNGSIQTVAGLLAQGANVNAVDHNGIGITALMFAAEQGNTEIVSTLLAQEGINFNAETIVGTTALRIAASRGHTEIVSILLAQEGINFNAVDSRGNTALMLAALRGHTEIVSILLAQEGINFNAVDIGGNTALMLAALKGHTEIVSILLAQERINFNVADSKGNTALMFAALNGHTEIVSILLAQEGINFNVGNHNGTTALMLAATDGHTEIVSSLLAHYDVDWQMVQNQLNMVLNHFNKETSALLAVIIPEEDFRNSIIANFNQRNPDSTIQQQNNDILGAGFEAYSNLNDLRSWHVRYLTDSGVAENEVKNLASQRFFYLLNHQEDRHEALARSKWVADINSASLIPDLIRASKEVLDVEDRRNFDTLLSLNPEDLYKLSAKIIENSKATNGNVPSLQVLSLLTLLKDLQNTSSSSYPATTVADTTPPAPPENIVTHTNVSPIVGSASVRCGGCIIS